MTTTKTKQSPIPDITQDGPAPDGGSYNDKPPHWREITAMELVRNTHYGSYKPDRCENRSVILPHFYRNGDSRDMYSSVDLQWFWDGTGIAVETVYWGVEQHKPEEERTYVRYYAFELCQHSYKEMSYEWCRKHSVYHGGMCWHVERCSKCGHIKAYDSSD